MSKTLSSLSVQQLLAAAKLKEKIHSLEKKLEGILGSSGESAASPAPKKKFKMSAAARAKISAAAKKRWAKARGEKPAASPAPKARRKMSAAAKAKLSAKLKLAWARRKAAKQ